MNQHDKPLGCWKRRKVTVTCRMQTGEFMFFSNFGKKEKPDAESLTHRRNLDETLW